ncbi:MAG: DinB family protein [Acidobacteriia bacterium]|nr:DinB family protein [Terriglobia bacterium]
MDAREKQELLESLESGREALLAALYGVTEDLAARVPEPGRWSVRECVEHLFLVENYLFAQIAASQPSERPVGSRAREARILERGADRTNRLEAPEVARPTGRFPTLGEALDAFLTSRALTIRYVHAWKEDPRSRTAHHPLIGPVNCYETLLIIAIHPHRHVQQIREVVSSTR